MTPEAVLFDCDGVIVDSEGPTFDLLLVDFHAHGLPLPREVIERDFLGGTMQMVAARARSAGARLPRNWVDDFYERLYARLAEGTDLIPGITGVLDALDARDIRYAIGSNGSERKMQVTLGQHPQVLSRLAGRIFSGQTLGAPKPAPDLWLHAARALGVAPADCVVVEDSPTGALAARAAGMRCLGFAPHGNDSALQAAGAEIFRSMAELPARLGI